MTISAVCALSRDFWWCSRYYLSAFAFLPKFFSSRGRPRCYFLFIFFTWKVLGEVVTVACTAFSWWRDEEGQLSEQPWGERWGTQMRRMRILCICLWQQQRKQLRRRRRKKLVQSLCHTYLNIQVQSILYIERQYIEILNPISDSILFATNICKELYD